MGKDASAIIIAGKGSLLVAPVGTTMPTDVETALPAAWVDLGYTTPDGVSFSVEKTTEDVSVWQSVHPARTFVTDLQASLTFTLRQWDKTTVPLAFGGGTITETAGPPKHWTYTPPEAHTVDERAAVIDFVDGTKKQRIIIPRVMVTTSVETKMSRTEVSDLPISLNVLGTDGVAPWTLKTNHTAFGA